MFKGENVHRDFTNNWEDLQIVESYKPFNKKEWDEKQVTLNELIERLEREQRKDKISDSLFVLEAIFKAAVLVAALAASLFLLIEFLTGA